MTTDVGGNAPPQNQPPTGQGQDPASDGQNEAESTVRGWVRSEVTSALTDYFKGKDSPLPTGPRTGQAQKPKRISFFDQMMGRGSGQSKQTPTT